MEASDGPKIPLQIDITFMKIGLLLIVLLGYLFWCRPSFFGLTKQPCSSRLLSLLPTWHLHARCCCVMRAMRGLRIHSANVNSVLSKLDSIKAHLALFAIDILLLQETKLDKSIDHSEIYCPGYSYFRLDRNRNGGGVALVIRDVLHPQKLEINSDSEILGASIPFGSLATKLTIISCYKPPKENPQDFCANLEDYLSNLEISALENVLLCGDFNLDPNENEYAPLGCLAHTFGLDQHICQPTHRTRCIDLCFTGAKLSPLVQCTLLDPIEKDHAVIGVTVKSNTCSPPPLPSAYPRPVYSKACWPLVRRCLAESGLLNIVVSVASVEEACCLWSSKVRQVIKDTIPHKLPQQHRKFSPPWMTMNIRKLLKQKSLAWKKWKLTSLSSYYTAYSRLRRICKKEIITSKRNFVERAFLQCKNIQQFWRTYRLLSNRRLSLPISFPSHSGQPCALLADQFDKVWNRTEVSAPCLVPEKTSHSTIAVHSVEYSLVHLCAQKSTGADGIPAIFLKNTCDVLAPSLTYLFNRSLSCGVVPSQWKDAIISPIPKCPNPQTPDLYRPIALLPIVSKVLESHFYQLLLPYVSPLLPDFQFGFRRGRGTVDCLAYFSHKVGLLVDAHQKVACVFFDVRKAFDSCVHSVLLRKLATEFQIPHNLLIWLRSYLSNRTYRVSANSTFSERKRVLSGVPQGSVLGPLLFLCYVNCIKDVKFSRNCEMAMFADDIVLFKPIPNSIDVTTFQSDVSVLQDVIQQIHLSFQPPKCKALILSYGNRVDHSDVDLYLSGVKLEVVTDSRYLGVIVDRKLSFVPHSRAATVRSKRAIGALCRKFRKTAPVSVLERVYKVCILPALLYGVEVWFPGVKHCKVNLERVQRLMARLLCNDFTSSYDSLLDRLGWVPIWKRVLYFRMRLFYKLLLSSTFSALLPLTVSRHSARLSHSRPVSLYCKKTSTANSFCFIASKIWNVLPDYVVTGSFMAFCNYIKSSAFFYLLASKNLLPNVDV
ncbi:MAG: RNA-directed DNA polymerase [Gammaproteobacteria bacterium]|nr:RNA-directed DNA polymerase [Gammaproteobacteria bacterium]